MSRPVSRKTSFGQELGVRPTKVLLYFNLSSRQSGGFKRTMDWWRVDDVQNKSMKPDIGDESDTGKQRVVKWIEPVRVGKKERKKVHGCYPDSTLNQENSAINVAFLFKVESGLQVCTFSFVFHSWRIHFVQSLFFLSQLILVVSIVMWWHEYESLKMRLFATYRYSVGLFSQSFFSMPSVLISCFLHCDNGIRSVVRRVDVHIY